jgi:hypothetical protein
MEWAQRGRVIPTCAPVQCAGRAVGVGAAAGVDTETCPKEVEQEEWRDACRRRECRRPEGLLLAQTESEGRWRAVCVGAGGERGAGPEVGAGQWAARDAAIVSERTRGIGAGRLSCLGGGETQ